MSCLWIQFLNIYVTIYLAVIYENELIIKGQKIKEFPYTIITSNG